MIEVKLPAHMTCDADGCQRSVDVRLCLLGTGGFAFKPKADVKDWQIAMSGNGMFVCRCAEHRQTIEQPTPQTKAIIGVAH